MKSYTNKVNFRGNNTRDDCAPTAIHNAYARYGIAREFSYKQLMKGGFRKSAIKVGTPIEQTVNLARLMGVELEAVKIPSYKSTKGYNHNQFCAYMESAINKTLDEGNVVVMRYPGHIFAITSRLDNDKYVTINLWLNEDRNIYVATIGQILYRLIRVQIFDDKTITNQVKSNGRIITETRVTQRDYYIGIDPSNHIWKVKGFTNPKHEARRQEVIAYEQWWSKALEEIDEMYTRYPERDMHGMIELYAEVQELLSL